jgi:RNA polymerase sigma factor (sigma-70 family)
MTQHERITDELLVLRCQEGDAAAFDQLILRWQERLWRHAWRLTGAEDAAWDALQETWTVVSRDIRRLTDAAAFPAWVYRINSNKCRDWVRRQSRRRRAEQAYSDQVRETREQAADQQAQAASLQEALAQLPGADRAILALYYHEQFAVNEIADILHIPAGTVKSRLYYARSRLRQFLEVTNDE